MEIYPEFSSQFQRLRVSPNTLSASRNGENVIHAHQIFFFLIQINKVTQVIWNIFNCAPISGQKYVDNKTA